MGLSSALSMAWDLIVGHWRLLVACMVLFAVAHFLVLAASDGVNRLMYLVYASRQRAGESVGIVLNITRLVGPMILGLIALVAQAMAWASVFRILLRSEDKGRLGFGSQEAYLLGATVMVAVLFWLILWPFDLRPTSPGIFSNWLASHLLLGAWLSSRTVLFLILGGVGVYWQALAAVWAFQRAEIAPFRCWRVLSGRTLLLSAMFVAVAIVLELLASGVALEALRLNHRYLRLFDSGDTIWSAWLFDVLSVSLLAVAGLICQATLVSGAWRTRQELTPPPSPR